MLFFTIQIFVFCIKKYIKYTNFSHKLHLTGAMMESASGAWVTLSEGGKRARERERERARASERERRERENGHWTPLTQKPFRSSAAGLWRFSPFFSGTFLMIGLNTRSKERKRVACWSSGNWSGVLRICLGVFVKVSERYDFSQDLSGATLNKNLSVELLKPRCLLGFESVRSYSTEKRANCNFPSRFGVFSIIDLAVFI